MMMPMSSSSSGSGSAEFAPIQSPLYPAMNHHSHMMNQCMVPQQFHFATLPNQSQQPPMHIPPEVAPFIDSVRIEAEQQVTAARAECDSKVQLARVRVAELEERLRISESEGDVITMQMTTMEVQKGEAERTRDSAVEKLEEIVALIKGSAGDETYCKWLEAELRSAREEQMTLSQTLDAMRQEFETKVKEEVERAMGKAASESVLPESAKAEEAGVLVVVEEAKPKKGKAKSDECLLNEILKGLREHMPMEKAVQMAGGGRSTKQSSQFITHAYLKGIKTQDDEETHIVAQFVAEFASGTVDSHSVLEGVAGVARQLGTLRKTISDADSILAGYGAALVGHKAATAKQLYDVVTRGAGKKPGKAFAVMLAHALKHRVGEREAASIINSKGGLSMGHVVGLEWLQTERRSPEESDYCADSRSASDSE